MSEALKWLAQRLNASDGPGDTLVLGRVTGLAPLRVVAEGTAQDPDSLMVNAGLDLETIQAGDALVLWPVEAHQRYVILCKVVGL